MKKTFIYSKYEDLWENESGRYGYKCTSNPLMQACLSNTSICHDFLDHKVKEKGTCEEEFYALGVMFYIREYDYSPIDNIAGDLGFIFHYWKENYKDPVLKTKPLKKYTGVIKELYIEVLKYIYKYNICYIKTLEEKQNLKLFLQSFMYHFNKGYFYAFTKYKHINIYRVFHELKAQLDSYFKNRLSFESDMLTLIMDKKHVYAYRYYSGNKKQKTLCFKFDL